MSLLEVKNVKKVYTTRFGAVKVQALNDVNFSVEDGEYVAIMGESGKLFSKSLGMDKAYRFGRIGVLRRSYRRGGGRSYLYFAL